MADLDIHEFTNVEGGIGTSDANLVQKVFTDTGVGLTTSDTTILSVTGTGILQHIVANFEDDKTELAVEIDGVEVFRFAAEDLDDTGLYNLAGDAKIGHVPIRLGRDSKMIIVDWFSSPAGYHDSFEVICRMTSGAKDLRGIIVHYREST
jgi:hypothetical protein